MTENPASGRDSSRTVVRLQVRGIFLVGFMGTGKSSVGRVLADRLGWEFIDLDEHIEAREGLSVPAIFRAHGEQGFREREHSALRALIEERSELGPIVVALGGGAFVQPENLRLLSVAGRFSVFLDTPVEELWERCLAPGEPERPLRTDPLGFRALHEKRRGHYMLATVRVETAGKNVQQIAQEVIENLGLQRVANKETSE
jgi:shikimate kinase